MSNEITTKVSPSVDMNRATKKKPIVPSHRVGEHNKRTATVLAAQGWLDESLVAAGLPALDKPTLVKA